MEYRKHVFTNHEKKLFLDIVRKYKKIVENRQTDGSTIKGKHAAWDQITCEYNASTMTVAQASSKQLRRLWTNMRQRQREAMVRARQNGTVVRLPSTDKDLAVSDITILNTAPNSDSQEIIKQEFDDTAKPSSASLQIPLSVSPPLSTVPPPLITLAAPLPCPSLTHLPQPHLTQIHRLSYHGREKLEAEPKRETLEEREYEYKKHHANKVHELEMEVLKEKLREAKAKAELAEFYLKLAKKECSEPDKPLETPPVIPVHIAQLIERCHQPLSYIPV